MLMGCFWGFWASTETLRGRSACGGDGARAGSRPSSTPSSRSTWAANQIISGTAINILALGVTSFAYRSLIGSSGTPDVDRIPNVHLPLIADIPFFGDIIGDLNLMVWVMFALVIVTWVFLTRTPWGLRLRSVGEHPRAADTVGIDVYRVRYLAVITSGVLAGMAGAFLSFGFGSSFNENMTAGRGFIALAAVVFGNWRPFGVLWAALLFGFASALANALQTAAGVNATLVNVLPVPVHADRAGRAGGQIAAACRRRIAVQEAVAAAPGRSHSQVGEPHCREESPMGRPRHSSRQIDRLLAAFMRDPGMWRYGYELAKDAGIPTGTLYPALLRLAGRRLPRGPLGAARRPRRPRSAHVPPDAVRHGLRRGPPGRAGQRCHPPRRRLDRHGPHRHVAVSSARFGARSERGV